MTPAHLFERIFVAAWMVWLVLIFSPLGPMLGRAWAERSLWKWKLVPQRKADGTMDYAAPPIMERWHILRATVRWRGKMYGREYAIHRLLNRDNMALGAHDHPWDFWSIVFKGWYVEKHITSGTFGAPCAEYYVHRLRARWSVASHPAEYVHAITDVSPGGCWTFVVTGPRIREWGFPEKRIVIA